MFGLMGWVYFAGGVNREQADSSVVVNCYFRRNGVGGRMYVCALRVT